MEKTEIHLDVYGKTEYNKDIDAWQYTMSFDKDYKDRVQFIYNGMVAKVDQHILESIPDKGLEKLYRLVHNERKRRYGIKTLCEKLLKGGRQCGYKLTRYFLAK